MKSQSLDSIRPEKFFTVTAAVFGLLLAILTAPFQAPDEPAHFSRIWQISCGGMTADHYGGEVPASLCDCFIQFEPLKFHPDRKITAGKILAEFHRPLDPTRRQYILFANTAIYSPMPYLPQVIMVLMGRIFSMPPIALMYLGRGGNAIAYALLGGLTIRILPILKWPACLILLSPLPIFLSGSLSADPVTTSLAFLATASVLGLIVEPQPASLKLITILTASLVGTALCKWTYFPIALLMLAIPSRAWGKGWTRRVIPLCIISCGLVAFAIWSGLSHPIRVPLRNGDPTAQLQWIKSHPWQYLRVIETTARFQLPTLAWSSIGILGQLDTKLSPWLVGAYLLLIVWATVTDSGTVRITPPVRMLSAAAILISITLIISCEYLVWNKAGNPTIEGIQGRYFIPLALMGMIVIRRNPPAAIRPAILQPVIIASCCYASFAVLCRYFQPKNCASCESSRPPLVPGIQPVARMRQAEI